jgi:glycosyltransferase involved in cell wall biosynthesis
MQKRILILSNRLCSGGAEMYAVTLANALVKTNTYVLLCSSGGNLISRLSKDVKHFEVKADARSFYKIFSCALDLRKILKDHQINIIHSNSVLNCLIAGISRFFMPVKIVHTAHSWGDNKTFLSAMAVNIFADRVIAVSEATAKKYIEHGVARKKFHVIHNGVDLELFSKIDKEKLQGLRQELNIPENTRVITTIARIEEERKGHKTLIDAASVVRKKFHDIVFLVTGNGPLVTSLKTMVSNYKLHDNIIFTGGRDDIPELLSLTDIFCLPSQWEGCPLVIAEAMACGVPVVASNVDGIPEMIEDGKTGYLIPAGESKMLAEKLIFLLENNEIICRMSEAATKKAKKTFSLDVMFKKTINIYNQVLDR